MQQLITFAVVLWIMIIGFSMIINGPEAAGKVFIWPFAKSFKLIRSVIGNLFVSTGNTIKGKPVKKKKKH